jgi:hypothetical protein
MDATSSILGGEQWALGRIPCGISKAMDVVVELRAVGSCAG